MEKFIIVELELAYPVINSYDFSFLREEKIVQEYLRNSHLYIIAQRSQLTFENVLIDHDKGSINFKIVQSGRQLKSVLNVYQSSLIKDAKDGIDIEFGSYNKENKFDTLPYNEVCGIKFFDGNNEFLSWISPEKLYYDYARGKTYIDGFDKIKNFNKYKVHYVGKATDQEIWKRLTGHEKLQDILSRENSFQYGSLPAYEIVLLLFKIKNIHNGAALDSIENINLNTILNKTLYQNSHKKIFLDVEKAFINLLNPTYNKVKFKKYPKSKDGLNKERYKYIVYTINDDITLEYDNGEISGALDSTKCDILIIENNKTLYLEKNC